MSDEISKFHKNFSAEDSLVFIMFPKSAPVLLGSLIKIIYSIKREKKPVELIGNVNPRGFTKGVRTITGTMVFELINQHWVNNLTKQIPWIEACYELKADELPLFDLMIICSSENNANTKMFIYGVGITNETEALSKVDIFTENKFSFVAQDIDIFSNEDITVKNLERNHSIIRKSSIIMNFDDAEIY